MENIGKNKGSNTKKSISQKLSLANKEYEKMLAYNLTLEKVINNDVRSPINSAVYALSKLKKILVKKKSEMNVLEIVESVSIALIQVNFYLEDILTINNVFINKYKVSKSHFLIDDIFKEVQKYCDLVFIQNENKIINRISNPLYLFADKKLFSIVIRNLIINSNLYGNSNITIQVKEFESTIALSISNSFIESSFEPKYDIRKKLMLDNILFESNDKYKLGLSSIALLTNKLGFDINVSLEENNFNVIIDIPRSYLHHNKNL